MSLPAPGSNLTVLVTGASAGIGTELARGLAARGYGLDLVARRRDRLSALAEELRTARGVDVQVHTADLSTSRGRKRLIAKLAERDGFVAGLCNNAGFGSFGRFQSLPIEREMEEVQLNVTAVHELTGAFLPAMIERGTGAVLNVGSIAGAQPLPGNATYAATKAFVNSFSEALHLDLAGTGVSSTLLAPGPVSTEFGEQAGVGDQEQQLPGFLLASAAEVAEEGIEGMLRGKRSVVPGIGPKVMSTGGRFAPRSVLLPVTSKLLGRQFGGDGLP